jgi:hypothetical protein
MAQHFSPGAEHWVPGFLSGNSPVLGKDGPTYLTREDAAEAAYATTPTKQLVVAHEGGSSLIIFEANRDASGKWAFTKFSNVSRVLGG